MIGNSGSLFELGAVLGVVITALGVMLTYRLAKTHTRHARQRNRANKEAK